MDSLPETILSEFVFYAFLVSIEEQNQALAAEELRKKVNRL
jgi:hypothetical protein